MICFSFPSISSICVYKTHCTLLSYCKGEKDDHPKVLSAGLSQIQRHNLMLRDFINMLSSLANHPFSLGTRRSSIQFVYKKRWVFIKESCSFCSFSSKQRTHKQHGPVLSVRRPQISIKSWTLCTSQFKKSAKSVLHMLPDSTLRIKFSVID